MKKIFKSRIFFLTLGMIITTTIGVTASVIYNSSEIGFTPSDTNWHVNNLQDAINDLYKNKGDEFTYITGLNNRTTGITSYAIEHDNEHAVIITGQGSMSYAINQGTNFTAVSNKLESSDYNGRATYYAEISVKSGDVLNVKRDSTSEFGYIIVY